MKTTKFTVNLPVRFQSEKNLASVQKIVDLDLEPIKFKLLQTEEHIKTLDELDVIEYDYKLFLICCAIAPEACIAPSHSIDMFWHAHIVDTAKYAKDCEEIFGTFLHHNPYFGMEATEGTAALNAAGETLLGLLKELAPTSNWASGELQAAVCNPFALCRPFAAVCNPFALCKPFAAVCNPFALCKPSIDDAFNHIQRPRPARTAGVNYAVNLH